MRNCYKCGEDFNHQKSGRVCPKCSTQTRIHYPVLLGQSLSRREKQIVAGVARGLPNKEIAFELHLTEGTIKIYVHSIFRKLGVDNRIKLAVWESDRLRDLEPASCDVEHLWESCYQMREPAA